MPIRTSRRSPALLTLLLIGAGCGDSTAPPSSTHTSDPGQSSAQLLRELAGESPSALDGVVLGWSEVDAAGKVGRKVVAALARPDRLRLEIKRDEREGGATVYKRIAAETWVGPAGGPFIPASADTAARIDKTMQLLAALLAWDLRSGAKAQLQDGAFVTRASWLAGTKELTVRRTSAAKKGVVSLAIGDDTYSLGKRFRGTGGSIAHVEATASRPGLRFDRFVLDAEFLDDYFKPSASSPAATVIEMGGEQHYFDRPRMVQLGGTLELEVEDPGTWAKRWKRLGEIGTALADLGQQPAGLPVYVPGKSMVVLFQPTQGKKAQAPKGLSFINRPRYHALVLSVKAPWKDAVESLTAKLTAHAKTLGLKPPRPPRMRPYLVPGEGEPPSDDAILTVRGELAAR